MYDLTNKIYCGPIHCRITPSLNFLSRTVVGEWLDSDSGLQIFLSLLAKKLVDPLSLAIILEGIITFFFYGKPRINICSMKDI